MAKISQILRSVQDTGLMFWCPGCEGAHLVRIGEGSGPRWSYNGDPEKPTFSPSILVKSGHYSERHIGDCWCTYEARFGKSSPYSCTVCHSFVRDGKIQFLPDSTHPLSGATVDIPSFDQE